jgi:hypothetical protein
MQDEHDDFYRAECLGFNMDGVGVEWDYIGLNQLKIATHGITAV